VTWNPRVNSIIKASAVPRQGQRDEPVPLDVQNLAFCHLFADTHDGFSN